MHRSMIRLMFVSMFVAGCVEPSVVRCGDLVCSTAAVCTPTGDRCVLPSQLESCIGLADKASCAYVGVDQGACVNGVCEEILCGDGRMIGPELCDDGNQLSGDGCSADCQSLEICGNAYVDSLTGEQCDAGAFGLSSDGCTSQCTIEVASWRDVSPVAPAGLRRHAMAYDARRKRTVMFGGFETGTVLNGQTWEWDGAVWELRTPQTSPSKRAAHAMAFDAARGVVVMFGGTTDDGDTDETWTWDGVDWRMLAPATSPPARRFSALAYDAERQRVVMFGGFDTVARNDTWTWDGTTWALASTGTAPPALLPTTAWDAAAKRVLLFVHDPIGGTAPQTWGWDGTAWSPLGGTQPTVYRPVMSAASSGEVFMFGAVLAGGVEQTWHWNGTWSQLSPPKQPVDRVEHQMVYDSVRDRPVMYGGSQGSSSFGDTWEWTGTAWSAISSALTPSMREDAAMVYQPLRGTTLLFGGVTPSNVALDDTWEWNGAAWRQVASTPLLGRGRHAMAATDDRVVLFGGDDFFSGASHDDTWEWNGSDWSERTPATKPPARVWHAMTYDRARARVVMFGGLGAQELDDTWEWDGTNWIEAAPAHKPPAQYGAKMTYDARRSRVVLVGYTPSVWEWDGTDWTERAVTSGPPKRIFSGLAFHATRGTVMMFGGADTAAFQDLWEWDGTAWSQINPVVTPGRRSQLQLAFDATRAQLVAYGGTFTGPLVDTWVMDFASASFPRDACLDRDTDGDTLVGCADPDCWGRCTPLCPPGLACDSTSPRCGDGTCSVLEDRHVCPDDC